MNLFKSDIEKFIEQVQLRTPSAKNISCVDTKKHFLRGSLHTFAFEVTDDKTQETRSFINRVYHHDLRIDVYSNDEQLLAIVGETHQNISIQEIFNQSSVAGLIAVMLTITICVLSFRDGSQIPDILKDALTVILGFYFGTKAAGKSTQVN